MKIQTISSKDYIVNNWSGGSTTQMCIFPVNSTLSERNFLWRISSASFTSTSSKFSDFSGYQRYLLALEGRLSVTHNGLYKKDLKPYEVEYFLGSWDTDSTNSLDCRDFNFIVKEGLESKLSILSESDEYIPKRNGKLCIFSVSDFQIELYTDSMEIVSFQANSLAIIEEEDKFNKLSVKMAVSPVIVCEVIEA